MTKVIHDPHDHGVIDHGPFKQSIRTSEVYLRKCPVVVRDDDGSLRQGFINWDRDRLLRP